mmetsp:Transcript_29416/g.44886  ORF Transcript_29416/g.44886 Transcript_29416/m.44886 type:complete len:345 (+) Transcript_29416:106-1140(+)|eukprot:CAMPEP_0194250592 /NCGR_PEP_ID=MMETSP0158-20130606/23452_1 /TAXON_ID=33649 /ORGANISM="Thalassionema nitzschioides, Strain L26-B" /LENGTH=344 /DNA_ID=CAMNT_0038987461 /DNA_START=44 /DNA_END=1078 /DNA_ORIENTATION=+
MVSQVQAWQIGAFFLFPFISIVAIFLAIVLDNVENKSFTIYGNVFSVGVLLSGGIVHGLGEATEMLEEYCEEEGGCSHFPTTYTTFGATIIFLVCIEAGTERFIDKMLMKKRAVSSGNSNNNNDYTSGSAVESENVVNSTTENNDNPPNDEKNDTERADTASGGECNRQEEESPMHNHAHDIHLTFDPWVSVLLTVVLSIHVIFENINFGATQDISVIYSLLAVICVHKFFASFALGSTLVAGGLYKKGGNKCMFYILVATFLSMNLIGLGIGMGISAVATGLVIAILTSITGGSFVFVALFEVLPGELEKVRIQRFSLWLIITALCIGYTAMTLLVLAEPEEH